jgi:hypothetical protein
MNTNSLKPLDDNITIHELMSYFDISEKKVKTTFKKLFELGVYGKFEVAKKNKDYTKYWIVNPYLSFKGKTIEKSITELFKGTHISIAFYNENYETSTMKPLKKKSSRIDRMSVVKD